MRETDTTASAGTVLLNTFGQALKKLKAAFTRSPTVCTAIFLDNPIKIKVQDSHVSPVLPDVNHVSQSVLQDYRTARKKIVSAPAPASPSESAALIATTGELEEKEEKKGETKSITSYQR